MNDDKNEPTPQPARPKRSDVLAIASKSFADPRTVERWMRGAPVRYLVGERLGKAARELGIEAPR